MDKRTPFALTRTRRRKQIMVNTHVLSGNKRTANSALGCDVWADDGPQQSYIVSHAGIIAGYINITITIVISRTIGDQDIMGAIDHIYSIAPRVDHTDALQNTMVGIRSIKAYPIAVQIIVNRNVVTIGVNGQIRYADK